MTSRTMAESGLRFPIGHAEVQLVVHLHEQAGQVLKEVVGVFVLTLAIRN